MKTQTDTNIRNIAAALEHNGAFLSGLVALLLYLATLSKQYTGGSLEFAAEIESGLWTALFQPQKLLIHPIGWMFFQLWKLLGWQGGSLLPSQILNAACGALSVGLLFHLIRQLTHSPKVAFWSAAGFMASSGVWIFSTEAEFVTPALAVMLFMLILTLRPPSDQRPPFQLGVFSGIAILFYITNIFFLPALAAVWIDAHRKEATAWLKKLLLLGTGVVPVVLPGFGALMVLVYGVRSWAALQAFHLYGGTGAGAGTVYGVLSPANLFFGAYAMTRTLATFSGLGLDSSSYAFWVTSTWVRDTEYVLFTLSVGVILAGLFYIAFRMRKALWQNYRAPLLALGVWSFLNLCFGFYWVPKDIQFWMPLILAWWILAGLTLHELFRAAPPINPLWLSFPSFLPTLLVVVNAVCLTLQHHSLQRNLPYQLAAFIADRTQPGDAVITAEDDRYIPYFSGRESISLFRDLVDPANNPEQVYAALGERITAIRARGGSVYLVSFPEPGNPLWRELNKAGLNAQDSSHFELTPIWEFKGRTIYLVSGLSP